MNKKKQSFEEVKKIAVTIIFEGWMRKSHRTFKWHVSISPSVKFSGIQFI